MNRSLLSPSAKVVARPLRWLMPGIGVWLLATGAPAQQATVLEVENKVQASRKKTAWVPAKAGESLAIRDRIRTREESRATVRLSKLYTMRLDEYTTIELTPHLTRAEKPQLDLLEGVTFIFSREQSGEIDIRTPAANAALRGTQLYARVDRGGKTTVQVLEGQVDLSNARGRLLLNAGEAGEVVPGQAPRRTAVIEARNLLQWALYYPAVLDPAELQLGRAERGRVAASLQAYRSGDLLKALERYPKADPTTAAGRSYKAAVLLAVGRVDDARALLVNVPGGQSGRRSLERMIAAVTLTPTNDTAQVNLRASERLAGNHSGEAGSASEAVAESYYQQAVLNLEGARAAARRATELGPSNGYAWTRLAELEFSFGRNEEANLALAKALGLTPRNAQAHALQGFVFAGRNRIAEARSSFDAALSIDGALGNAWLGRGLTRIRKGDLEGGRSDLQVAATVEPTRSLFHSYLGKALSEEGMGERARKDLDLARVLDPRDPTPWLYSALEHQRKNQPNRAIADLETSIDLNDKRRLFRSRYLLDQDRAVRSANLAKIYQNAGMQEVAVREATRAVESDYTNPSAHLFLANSFDALRDPNRISLRYETPWFNELLLSNLLSPVGGGPLSQFVSQQEYSKLLASDGIGGSVFSEWRSDSELRTTASMFGTHGNVSYGIDANYRDYEGSRLNADSSLFELYAQLKWQVTPDDTLYLLGKWQDQSGGDQFQTFDNRPLSPQLDFEERQEPGLLLAGWNHRWKPGVHTLVLGGRLAADQQLRDPRSGQLLVERDAAGLRPGFIRINPATNRDEFTDPALHSTFPNGVPTGPDGETLRYTPELPEGIAPHLGRGGVLGVLSSPFEFETRREFEINSAEVQHIVQSDTHTLLLGGRFQQGKIRTTSTLLAERPNFYGGFSTPAAEQTESGDLQRRSLYAYDYRKVNPALSLIGGVTWDWIEHPVNFRNPPISSEQRVDERVSGKFGFTYAPADWITVRGAFAQGLGGVTFDESVRLEPVQLAGFNQSYRTVISESLAGSVETPEFTTYGLSIEGSLPSRTWWGLGLSVIEQDVSRTRGVFTGYSSGVFEVSPAYFADGVQENLAYREVAFSATANQLIGDEFALGARYRLTRSELDQSLPDLAGSLPEASLSDAATLHELSVFADWNSRTGFFAHAEANWYSQDLDDDPSRPARKGDEFLQLNLMAGRRFHDNDTEISVGVMNLLDTDYRLSPINPYLDMPRERTLLLRFRRSF